MTRESLVRRNQQMTAAFHSPPIRHQLRRRLLNAVANFRFAPSPIRGRRVLFIKPDHLGDMLLATPAIRAFKQARPYTEIHVLAGAWAAPILAAYPEIDRVLTLPFPGFDRSDDSKNPLAPYLQLIRVSRQLRQIGYTSAVILRPDHWWGAMLAHVTGIQERIGYQLDDMTPFLTRAVPHRHEHVIRQNMRLVEHWTGIIDDDEVPYTLPVYDDDRDFVQDYLLRCGVKPHQPVICMHPGSGTWVKQWENAHWAKVADTLADQMDAAIVFTGNHHEMPLIGQIQNLMQHKACLTAGDMNLGQLAALYEHAKVVLGCDSGPVHIAAAVGVPTVALFGPADPIEFGTWGDKNRHIVLTSYIGCRPCRVLDWGDDDPTNHPCVREITVAQVLEAARWVTSA